MAAKGGGAWKVAYADFVTALMAFFLVMWICGQDQEIRRAVSYYFNDPYNSSKIGSSKQPNRSGSISDLKNLGSVPLAESAALGQGRKSYTPPGEPASATQLIGSWIHAEPKRMQYWEVQARRVWTSAGAAKEVQQKETTVERVAAAKLASRLKREIMSEMAGDLKAVQQDLLLEALQQVNWLEIAEDLLAR